MRLVSNHFVIKWLCSSSLKPSPNSIALAYLLFLDGCQFLWVHVAAGLVPMPAPSQMFITYSMQKLGEEACLILPLDPCGDDTYSCIAKLGGGGQFVFCTCQVLSKSHIKVYETIQSRKDGTEGLSSEVCEISTSDKIKVALRNSVPRFTGLSPSTSAWSKLEMGKALESYSSCVEFNMYCLMMLCD